MTYKIKMETLEDDGRREPSITDQLAKMKQQLITETETADALQFDLVEMRKERDAAKTLAIHYSEQLAAMTQERDAHKLTLIAALKYLAESQAREQQLRDALDSVLELCELNGMHSEGEYQRCKAIFHEWAGDGESDTKTPNV